MKFKFEKNEVFEKKYKITTYPGNYTKIEMVKDWKKPGFEACEEKKSSFHTQYDQEDLVKQAKSRAKRNFLDLALCNNFEYFFTITCDSEKVDRFSIEATQELLKKVFKKTKRSYPDFKYIVCTEVHPQKKGYHFHRSLFWFIFRKWSFVY